MLPARPNAVLTGASSGLGRAIAKRLAARGAHLLLADVDQAGGEETCRLVEAAGGQAKFVQCDVSRADAVERLHEESQRELGHVDLLVNNAGVAVGGQVGTVPLADWDWIVGVNLWGVIYGCHYFLPKMKQRGSGHILNVASIAAFACGGEMGPYNVTKAGVVALSETLAGELKDGLGCTVLCPYFFQTNIAKSSRSTSTKVGTDMIEKLMSKTSVQAEQVADKALEACDRNELYVFPHKEAKTIAFLKRSAPETLLKKLAPWLSQKLLS